MHFCEVGRYRVGADFVLPPSWSWHLSWNSFEASPWPASTGQKPLGM